MGTPPAPISKVAVSQILSLTLRGYFPRRGVMSGVQVAVAGMSDVGDHCVVPGCDLFGAFEHVRDVPRADALTATA